MNKKFNEHNFLITLKMDDKIIATRNVKIDHYNEKVIHSLKLNELMKGMCELVEKSLKDFSVDEAYETLNFF